MFLIADDYKKKKKKNTRNIKLFVLALIMSKCFYYFRIVRKNLYKACDY